MNPYLFLILLVIGNRMQWVIHYIHYVNSQILTTTLEVLIETATLLLSLFINRANRFLRYSHLLAFSDDIKLFIRIYSINDYHLFQSHFI